MKHKNAILKVADDSVEQAPRHSRSGALAQTNQSPLPGHPPTISRFIHLYPVVTSCKSAIIHLYPLEKYCPDSGLHFGALPLL
jgi:hypothetical protein